METWIARAAGNTLAHGKTFIKETVFDESSDGLKKNQGNLVLFFLFNANQQDILHRP